MMPPEITLNTPVAFAGDAGETKTGKVAGIKRDLSNGQGYAVVEIDADMPGIIEIVALDKLERVAQ